MKSYLKCWFFLLALTTAHSSFSQAFDFMAHYYFGGKNPTSSFDQVYTSDNISGFGAWLGGWGNFYVGEGTATTIWQG